MSRLVPSAIVFLACAGTIAAQSQELNLPRGSAPPGVFALASATLNAIRNRDTVFLAAVADPDGINIGLEANTTSVARFREDLVRRRGSYCVILDASCFPGRTSGSLRDWLGSRSVIMRAHPIDGAPDQIRVDVAGPAPEEEELFTLTYRCANRSWVLTQIGYR